MYYLGGAAFDRKLLVLSSRIDSLRLEIFLMSGFVHYDVLQEENRNFHSAFVATCESPDLCVFNDAAL
jgi:hypothetical protein